MDNLPFPAAFIDDIPQVCILCGIYFSNALSLQYHMRLHTGQDPTLFESRPPAVPTTTNSPTNGTITPSLGSNSSGSAAHGSSTTSNSTAPKQDFELGLEFLNSLTQMYANPSASRESKEKGYDFRYDPNTNSQAAVVGQDVAKHTESQKYNFDDYYNSPGDEVLDKKFESVLNFELSKDNGMHFGDLKEPLAVLDEPVLEKEKAGEKLIDNVSQMYHNELKNELDNISNDSIKSDEDEHKFNGIKIPDLPDSENEEKLAADKSAAATSVALIKDDQTNDSPSYEDEIPKVGKFMKIKKYFQTQEMRKKERSSVEKSDTCISTSISQGNSTSVSQGDSITSVSQAEDKADQLLSQKEAALRQLDMLTRKKDKTKTNVSKKSDSTISSVEKKKVEKMADKKVDSQKEEGKEEQVGISLRSLRRRPNKGVDTEKKQIVKKKANPKKCIRKEQVDEKLKALAQKNELDMKDTRTEKVGELIEKVVTPKIEDLTKVDECLSENNKQISSDEAIINKCANDTDEKSTEKEIKVPESIENVLPTNNLVDQNNEKFENKTEQQIITEVRQDLLTVGSEDPISILNPDPLSVVDPLTILNPGPISIGDPICIGEIPFNKESETESRESEDSDVDRTLYGQETVEPLKIKIYKIKPHKKKKHKKKKRKKDKKERNSFTFGKAYTEMDEFNSVEVEDGVQHHKPKRSTEKKHICEHCGQGFGQRCDLRKHVMIHTGERPWSCEICEKTFQRKTDLHKHTRIHTGEKPYECEYCGKKVSDKSQLNVHRRLHTGDRPYQCDVCFKGCITSSELTRHKQTHYSDRPWKCEVCQKGFKLKECLTMHMKTHNGTKKYQCAKCGLGFDRESKLETHMRLHETDSEYMCVECGTDFDDKAQYTNHIRSHKRELGPYSCEYCGRLFEHRSNLEPHIRSHTGEKPFICELCNSSYSLKGNLKHHMKVHHANIFYKCEICSETFLLKRDLINHSKIHPEDQLHCHYCDSRFPDQEAADNHRDECSARKNYYDASDLGNHSVASILDDIDDDFAKNYTPQGKLDQPPVRDKKELDKIYEFDESDSDSLSVKTKTKSTTRKQESHSHMSPRNKEHHLHMSPRKQEYHTHTSPKGAKRSRDPEIPKPLTISALLNSPPMNKKQKHLPQPKVEKADPFQGVIDKSAVLSNKGDDLDLFQRTVETAGTSTLPNLSVSDKTDLFENIIASPELGETKDSVPVTFPSSLSITTESSVFASKDSIDSLLSTASVNTEQQATLPNTSDTENPSAGRPFAPGYQWKNDLPPTDYVNSLLHKSLNGPSTSCTKYDADDSLSKFNLDYLNPLIMKTLNSELKFDTNENLQKSNSFYPTSSASSSAFSPNAATYTYKPQFSAPSDTRAETYTTADYMTSLARTIGMPNVEKLAMDYLYQSSIANEKQDFQQKFGLTGKSDPSVPLPSFNFLNTGTGASNPDTLTDALDMSAFAGLPSMSAFSRNTDFNAHLTPSAFGSLDLAKSLPSGDKIDDAASLLSNFDYGS